ncbi:MAG: glycosyltransferase family 2 protein [Pseudomonadota bacterium]
MSVSLSLITATFNAAATLEDNIRSVAGQTAPVEHILVDGGSRDNTMHIVDAHRTHFAQVVSEPDDGLYDAMNKGIRIANGDVVGILNADDFYPESGVLDAVSRAFEDSSIGACYGDLWYVDGEDTERVTRRWTSGRFDPKKFYWGWMPPHPTFFVRRELYDEFGDFNLALGSAADYELMLRFLLRHKVGARYIPRVLVHMRAGGVSNASVANRLAANRMDREAWRVNHLEPYPWTTVAKPLRKIGQWIKR